MRFRTELPIPPDINNVIELSILFMRFLESGSIALGYAFALSILFMRFI